MSTGRDARRLDTVPTCLQPRALRLSGPAGTTSQAVLTLVESGPGCSCPGTRLDHTKAETSWVPAARCQGVFTCPPRPPSPLPLDANQTQWKACHQAP